MQLYNSLSQTVEPCNLDPNAVRIYVCGITPYDTTHLGHAFTYCMADVLIRYLEFRHYNVTYVQNVTDIDDDILRKAKEVGENWKALGDYWTAHFIQDMQTLNVRPPEHFPRATSVIPEIVDAVQALIRQEMAYEAAGTVYYRVDAWQEFGKLSHIPRADMLEVANERGNKPDAPGKLDPLDFVLWQAQAPGEPAWESPWGMGRPGWHIECSIMSSRFLGDTLDFHGGGSDLLFPHHECEIAQIEPITGKQPYVHYWFHTAMVEHEGEKMSKSLGNLVMARDLLQTYTPDALRHYLADHHYRKPWEYDEQHLQQCAARVQQLATAAARQTNGGGEPLETESYTAAFIAALDNDLDTNTALGVLDRLAETIQHSSSANLAPAQAQLRALAAIFGLKLDQTQPDPRVVDGWDVHLRDFTPANT